MVTKKNIYLLFSALFFYSCSLFYEENFDKKALTYKNQFMFDNQFRMDGMYLLKDQYGIYLNYFFQNGSYYAAGISDSFDNNSVDCHSIPQGADKISYYWGCFITEDNILKIQTYTSVRYQTFNKYKVEERWAEIVNDTTLYFFKVIDPGGKERKLDETFHFRYCVNKPDSTNILMRD